MQEMYGKTDLEKFVFFIKEFKENLSQYKGDSETRQDG